MSSPEIQILSVLRILVEVPLFAFIGQGVLALMAGGRCQENPIYRLFQIVTAPVLRVLRALFPKLVTDGKLSFLAFALLFLLWIWLGYLKLSACRAGSFIC